MSLVPNVKEEETVNNLAVLVGELKKVERTLVLAGNFYKSMS